MVLHQCVGVKIKRIFGFTVGKLAKEFLEILFVTKYPLSVVSPADHMVESAGKMNPRSASHKKEHIKK